MFISALLKKPILHRGDCSVTLAGGHTYLILEDGTLVYEYKTGPYKGIENDGDTLGSIADKSRTKFKHPSLMRVQGHLFSSQHTDHHHWSSQHTDPVKTVFHAMYRQLDADVSHP